MDKQRRRTGKSAKKKKCRFANHHHEETPRATPGTRKRPRVKSRERQRRPRHQLSVRKQSEHRGTNLVAAEVSGCPGRRSTRAGLLPAPGRRRYYCRLLLWSPPPKCHPGLLPPSHPYRLTTREAFACCLACLLLRARREVLCTYK